MSEENAERIQEILSGTNTSQLEAITHVDGPCLVVAGAGTGKTSVITKRIAHLVLKHDIEPERIAALTFTDKAAGEMQERLDEILPYGTFVTTSTFHSFCNELIRRHAFRIGINPEARLITEADQVAILREHMERLPLEKYRRAYNPTPLLKQIARYVEQAKEAQLTPAVLIKHAGDALAAATEEPEAECAAEYLELAQCYRVATELYTELDVLTYADLLRHARDILQSSPLVQKEERERFQYLLIDEYQDTNTIQAEIAYLIAGEQGNLFVVGDDDQAIYRFRGANVKNILDFKDRFPQARVVTLTQNYRSTQAILDAAYRLIQNNNPHRLEAHLGISKQLVAEKGEGTEPTYLHYSTGTHEAEGVATTIQGLLESGEYAPTDIAVIARSHNQLDSFHEEIEGLGVPVSRAKEGNFFQEPSVVQALAFLRFLSSPHNSENLFRLLTGEPFDVSGEAVAEFNILAKKRHQSLWTALKSAETIENETLATSVQYCEKRLAEHAASAPSTALRAHICGESNWQTKLIEAAEERAAIHLNSLYNQARTFELLHQPTTILSFVDHTDRLIASGEDVTVQSELSTPTEGITLITAHSSKGLEFPVVFVVNMVMRRFPLQMSGGSLQLPLELVTPLKDNVPHEEERRLAYVAFTRAKERLYLTDAARYGTNKTGSKPSPFVTEALPIPETPDFSDQELRGTTMRAPVEQVVTREGLAFPRQLSASALEAFEDNPAVFYEQYVLQIIPEDITAINFGNAVHNTLRDIFNARREKVELDLEETFARHWVGEGYATSKDRDTEREAGLQMIRTHLAALAPDFYPAYVEEPITLQLSDGFRITGKVDRIDLHEDGTHSIIDYKTGSKEAKEADVRENLPLGLYAAALIQQRKQVREISLCYLRTKSNPCFSVKKDYLVTHIERAKAIVEKMRSAYANRDFPDSGKRYGSSYIR
ncbi:MAG TPA: ATP-dependent DNA helicase [Verrucomicrobiae bacterium]|nr:ATP-dependent DNA helicase [Verrucomicrobiae bacterium]